MIKGLMDFD